MSPHASDAVERGENNVDDRNSAGSVIQTVAAAWNKNDVDAIAGLFLPDAVLVMPTGSVVRSRAAIKQRIIDERNGKLKDTTLQSTVAAVSLPSNQAAVVRGNYQVHGMKILGIETSPIGRFVFHQRRHSGRWMIAKAEIFRGGS